MKTKSIILLSICAIVTLSFSFTSGKKTVNNKEKEPVNHVKSDSHHDGGFALEDKMI